ncbi:MAG: energy-coupling factor transporter transmembrane protein EcfT [Muribaculaceae bacterium]|nr:energy-coupling factor transporter transmembrane protein EcfT [Muribaculaceae bacterium]
MTKLEKAYLSVSRIDGSRGGNDSSPASLLVTVIYLIAVLSVPIDAPQKIIWLGAYPVIASEMQGIGYGKIFLKSLWILPLLIVIGIFNPILDNKILFYIGNVGVSRGWVTFASIIFRGLFSFQAIIIMIRTTGFIDVFNTMRRLGMPEIITTQMLLSYRYLFVILEEAMTMQRARESRGYGRKSYPLKMWGLFVGQLLIKSTKRATNIHRAMKARGFNGTLPMGSNSSWSIKDIIWTISWAVIIILLRFIDFSKLITEVIR